MRSSGLCLWLAILLLAGSCTSFQKMPRPAASSNERIHQVIDDFYRTRRLSRKSSVFNVSVTDTVNRMVLRQGQEGTAWVAEEPYDGLSTVTIRQNGVMLLLTDSTVPGQIVKTMPSRLVERKGKLFFGGMTPTL